MPTFIFTSRETQIIVDALNTPVGVSKVDRGLAQNLVDRIRNQTLTTPVKPSIKHTGYIRSPWPDNPVTPDRKPRDKAPKKVSLPKTTTPNKIITIEDVLAGLLP